MATPNREFRDFPATDQAIRADALIQTLAQPAGGDLGD